jgi:hypothetical protein
MPSAGVEPTITVGERLKNYALDRAATVINVNIRGKGKGKVKFAV